MGNFPDSLLRALHAGRVLPFVGAGVSRSVRTRTGRPAFPTWLELLEHCAHRLIDEHKPAIAADVRTRLAGATPDLLGAADVARRALFGRRWGDFLKEHFDPSRDALDDSSFDLSQAIWSIQSPLVVTTNYDHVMEWACPHAADCQSWPTEAPAELARALDGTSQRSAVWHLHGKIHQLDQLILTSADYERLYPSDRVAADYVSALATLRSLLAIKTFVFFGFSLSDERFLSTLLAVNETYRHTVGPHYAFVHRDDLQRLTPRAHDLCLELLPFDAFGPPLVAMVCDLAAARGRVLPPEDPPAATPSATQPVVDLRPNLLLGRRYRIQQRLGHGGFATVWKAHDEHTSTAVAIKVLHPHLSHDDERVQRFERGAARMGALHHPNIVRVLAPVASDGPFRYFVMELLHADLATTVRNVRLPEGFVVGLLIQLGSALSHAHAHGLVHRDVKPANVLVDIGGAPKLTDFDLVLAHDSSGGTRTGALGTFLFAAPEVIADPSSADETADVFGLAMTAVFLFHGRAMGPEAYRNAGEFIERHLSCNNAVKSTLARACNWQRERRQRSVEEFCAHLQHAANQPRTPPTPNARDIADPPRPAMPSMSESDPAWARRQPAAPSPSTNQPRTPHPPAKPPAKDVVAEPPRPAMPSLSESDPAWARRRPAAAPGPSTSQSGPLEFDLDEERPTARRSSSTSYLLVGTGALVGLIIWQAPHYMESEVPESPSPAPTPVDPSPPDSSPPPKDTPSIQTRPRPTPNPSPSNCRSPRRTNRIACNSRRPVPRKAPRGPSCAATHPYG